MHAHSVKANRWSESGFSLAVALFSDFVSRSIEKSATGTWLG